ncbi:MAG: sugar phosphate isomerase/epimerase family protein [Verrucomicrobiia bacterium]|jgi:sugar phosphate isomerase/epimerase
MVKKNSKSSFNYNRRRFLVLTVASSITPILFLKGQEGSKKEIKSGKKLNPIRIGGPSFRKEDDPEKLALAHRELGYSAAYCPNVNLNDKERIKTVRLAFEKHNVVIAEVGRWCNLLDQDPEKRKKNLQIVTDGLALADEIGALCCVDIAGSFNPKVWFGPHPENFSQTFFDAAVENARKIIDAVKPTRAKFCYEMMGWAIPESPDRYLKLLKAVDRKQFGVHLDVCNLINSPEKFYRNTDLINECFDKLGKWIVSSHAKDLTWDVEMNVHFREVIPGTGSVDYKTWLLRLAQLNPTPPLMIEHLASADEYDKARQFIVKTAKELGIELV